MLVEVASFLILNIGGDCNAEQNFYFEFILFYKWHNSLKDKLHYP